MNEDSGVTYLDAWQLNAVIQGLMGVGVVVKSNHTKFEKGDLVSGTLGWPWKLYFTKNVKGCEANWEKVNIVTSSALNLLEQF